MKDNNNMIRLGLVALLFIASTSISAKNDNIALTTDKVGDLVIQVNQAFDDAEKSVLGANPDPPKPEPLGPDPDPDKCICKGTGIITHGDGHTTDCPYHKRVDDTTACAEDCKGDCDKSCNCANNSGCVQQAGYQQEIIEKNFLEKNSVKFQKYIWENAKDKRFFIENSVNRFPTIILKKDGKVIVRTTGYRDKSSFKSLINSKISKGR